MENEVKEKKNKKEKVKKPLWREILEWVVTILAAVAIALAVRTLFFEPVKVDGHSMDDTLADGEIMLVTKTDYLVGNPSRFDVVICNYPNRTTKFLGVFDTNVNFVKRIVGLPGDTVEIKGGYLYVNGEKYDEPYINDEYRTNWGSAGYTYGPCYVPKKGETFTDVNGNEVVADEDYYFVMGDHRDNSNDSRAQGPIKRSMIVGHVQQIVWPLSSWRSVPNGLDVTSAN